MESMGALMNNVIYTAVDRNYENYARACFNSLKKNYPDHPMVLVYTTDYDNLSDEFIKYINTSHNFYLKKCRQPLEINNLGPVNNDIVYLKYMLWNSQEFADYDTVLHLDCDTLVLAPLDDIFTDEFLIFDNDERSKDFSMFNVEHMNFDFNNTTVFGNAGVFSVPKKYRTPIHFDSLNELTRDYEDALLYADQSAINLWCIENRITVSKDVRYNFQPQFFSYSDCEYLLDDVKILHFAARKPDTIEFLLWWRVKNGLAPLLHTLYKEYLNQQ